MDEDIRFRLWKFAEHSVRDERQHIMSLPRFRVTDEIFLNEENYQKVTLTHCSLIIPFSISGYLELPGWEGDYLCGKTTNENRWNFWIDELQLQ